MPTISKHDLHTVLERRVKHLLDQGYHVVPIRTVDPERSDRAKAPAMPAGYMERPLEETDNATLTKILAKHVDGIAVVTGPRSLHDVHGAPHFLMALELEGRAVNEDFLEEWEEAVEHIGAANVMRNLEHGWVETTGGGGKRWLFRVPAGDEETAADILRLIPRIQAVRADGVYAELLVDKHQTIVAPSGGRTHPSGGDWEIVKDNPAPVVTVGELYLLADLLAQVDEVGGTREGMAGSALDAASGRARQVASDYHRNVTTEAVVEILCANGFRFARTDAATGATIVDLVSSPGHGEVSVGGSKMPPGGVWSFSTSAAACGIPADQFVSAFEVRAIFDADAQGDLETLAEKMLKTGEARLMPWGLMARRRPLVYPDDVRTDVLVMQTSRALADARHPKDDTIPFALAQTTEGGDLVSMVSLDREGGLRRWSPTAARTLLLSVIQPARAGKDGKSKMLHTLDPSIVEAVLPQDAAPSGVATVRFVSTQPVLLPSGAVLTKSGLYRQHSALVAIPKREQGFWSTYRVPERPTAADAQRAADYVVTEVLSDFPFATLGDRARALSLLLTAATRSLYGAAPAFGLDAADRGTGKSLLARLAREIGLGRAAALSVSPLRVDDAETGKSIVAAALDGIAAVHIDELPRGQHITSRVLSELITSDGSMTQRVLGSNRSVRIPPMLCTVCGNNMELGADMQRRFVPIRMVHAGAELAFERAGFRHANLPRWVRENRPRVLAALHTIAAYGIQQAPKDLPAIGSFEEWSRVVLAGMSLINVDGVNGADLVMDGRRDYIDSQDTEGDEWVPFMQAWEAAFGTDQRVRSNVIYKTLNRSDIELPSVLLPQHGQSPNGAAKSWGRALLHRRDTAVRSGEKVLRLRCYPDAKRGNAYMLEVSGSDVPPAPRPVAPPAPVDEDLEIGGF